MKTGRKTKFVVWLNNTTDHRDDEWEVIWAHDSKEAHDIVAEKFKNSTRFTVGRAFSIREFRKLYGQDWPV